MSFMAIGLLTLLVSALVLYRRSVEERIVRWRLFAQRDRLRDLAYHDRSLLNTKMFRRLDRNITFFCAELKDISIWSIAPFFVLSSRVERERVEEIHQAMTSELATNEDLAKCFHDSVDLMMRHLLIRHLFISTVVGITIIGAIGIHKGFRWAAERIVSGAFAKGHAVSFDGGFHLTPIR